MIKDAEIAIVGAVSKALQLMNKDPTISPEEIIQEIMSSVNADSIVMIPAIASVNNAIKLKRHYKNMTDRQITQQALSDYRENPL
jgi:hypothetical protein